MVRHRPVVAAAGPFTPPHVGGLLVTRPRVVPLRMTRPRIVRARIDRLRVAVLLVTLALAPACSRRADDRGPQAGGPPLPTVVSGAEVKTRLAEGPRPLVIDTRSRGRYDEERVAGSVSVPLDDLLPFPEDGLDEAFRQRVLETVRAAGVRDDTETVVVEHASPEGLARAASFCWALSLAGLDRCRVLNGGLGGFKAAAGETARGPRDGARDGDDDDGGGDGRDGGAGVEPRIPARPTSLATLEQLRIATANGDPALLDAGTVEAGALAGAARLRLARLVGGNGVVDLAAARQAALEAGLGAETEVIVLGDGPQDGALAWLIVARHVKVPLVRLFPGGLARWRRAAAGSGAGGSPAAESAETESAERAGHSLAPTTGADAERAGQHSPAPTAGSDAERAGHSPAPTAGTDAERAGHSPAPTPGR